MNEEWKHDPAAAIPHVRAHYTRPMLIKALAIGPQSVRPPSLHSLSKKELMGTVCRALQAGGQAGEVMAYAISITTNMIGA